MLGTINVWLLIGFVLAIVYLLWQNHVLGRAIVGMMNINNFTMNHLNDALEARDKVVDDKLDDLNERLEYYEEKDAEVSEVSSK